MTPLLGVGGGAAGWGDAAAGRTVHSVGGRAGPVFLEEPTQPGPDDGPHRGERSSGLSLVSLSMLGNRV